MPTTHAADRVDWVDAAKGLCILLVVMMHATFGVEKTTGTTTALNGFIEWARPFRMPDFFLISGLFLAARINRPWPQYLDSKVVYFAYFYVLWLTIQFALKAPTMIVAHGFEVTLANYVFAFIQPWGTLWFIYMLAVFFVAARLLDEAPKALVWTAAAMLYLAAPETGWLLIDEFASRFVFFYTGYWAAPAVFTFAGWVGARAIPAVVAALIVWAAANWVLVENGLAFIKGPDLIVSFAGVAAVIAFSVLLRERLIGRWFSALGRNSIKIYLAFPLFMGPARMAALKLGDALPTWSVALISTAAGVGGALFLAHLVRDTRFNFLFARPDFAKRGAARPAVISSARLSQALAPRPQT